MGKSQVEVSARYKPNVGEVDKPVSNHNSWVYILFKSSLAQWFWTLGFIIGGCCSNAYALEILVTDAPQSGNLITFAQFILVALEGLLVNVEFNPRYFPHLKQRKIPLSRWLIMVLLFFFSSQLNNLAFGYKIPMTLHIIFRSGSLIANMLLGVLILRKRYSLLQVVSIFFVTAGVVLTTFSTVGAKKSSPADTTASQQILGVGILTVALFMAAFLGVVQEVTYAKYGKHWREGLFYTHALSLPFFILFYRDISQQYTFYSSSHHVPLPGYMDTLLTSLGFERFPKLFFYLLLNIGTQYFCVSGVQRLSSMSTALTLNLVLTIRKMLSIIFSVVYFRQPVTFNFLVGTFLAFGGTFIYSIASLKYRPASNLKSPKKKAS